MNARHHNTENNGLTLTDQTPMSRAFPKQSLKKRSTKRSMGVSPMSIYSIDAPAAQTTWTIPPFEITSDKNAFTLVELLVVIGIIALLIAILLPALNKARDQSKRVACLSNLHEIDLAYRTYATENQDFYPVGFVGWKQFNYIIDDARDGNAGQPAAFFLHGVLYQDHLLKVAKLYTCPAQTDQDLTPGSSTDPWPPPTIIDGGAFSVVKTGYSVRPEYAPNTPNATNTTGSFDPRNMVHLHELKNKAVMADNLAAPIYIATGHAKGINVLYANGSAHWVPLAVLYPKGLNGGAGLALCPNPIAGGFSYNAQGNQGQDEIWGLYPNIDGGQQTDPGWPDLDFPDRTMPKAAAGR